MKCNICGGTQAQLDNTSWNQLNVFHFNIFPDELVIITNASEEEFDKAVDIVGQSHETGDIQNIDAVLIDMGFVCLAASNRPVTVTF